MLRQQLDISLGKTLELSESEHETLNHRLDSSESTEEIRDSMNTPVDDQLPLMKQDDMQVNSYDFTPNHNNPMGISGENTETDGKVAEGIKVEKKDKFIEEASPCRRSEGLLVDFGETPARRCHSLIV